MPKINLQIPENSRFSSSLNEIDLCMKEIYLHQMRLADPRDTTGNPNSKAATNYVYTVNIAIPGIGYTVGSVLDVVGTQIEVLEVSGKGETQGAIKKIKVIKNSNGSILKDDTVNGKLLKGTGEGATFKITSTPRENWLWKSDRVFQVDELTIEDIFDTWLLRNQNKNIDIQYPLLAYKQNDLDTVFWGTGNRYKQWNITTSPANGEPEVGDYVIIVSEKYAALYGVRANIQEITPSGSIVLRYESTGNIVCDNEQHVIYFSLDEIRQTGDKAPISYKAKAITGSYSAVILVDNRDEAQYLRDHFILRCADANIWFTYNSPVLNNSENQIYTVFGIPNLKQYPTATDKLKGKGYIYGIGFDVDVWAAVTDTPLTLEAIEAIRYNLSIEGEDRTQRFVIN